MRHTLKFILGFLLVFAYRLIPFRPANVEPLLATVMPFSKRFGWLAAGLFGAGSIVIFDLVTFYGPWTLPTAICYGLISSGAALFFNHRPGTATNYVLYSVPAIILYDFLTGPLIPTVFGNGNFLALSIAQIPFTLNHLAGGIIFAAILSPLLDKYLVNASFWELEPTKTSNQPAARRS